MRILLANPRGFCAGVAMAIEVVDQLLDLLDGEPLFVYHEIVHNRHVVDRFRDRGVTFVERIEDVPPEAVVVFSAHGVAPQVRRLADERRLVAIDATCPLVLKVHAEAIRYARQGHQILLVGHADHQEVIGTRGQAPDAIQVVESPDDIPGLVVHDPRRLVYLTQTTLSLDDAQTIIEALKRAFPKIKAPPSDDICYATTNRQIAVRRLAPRADLVLVVGSRNSSNSRRLVEIAEHAGTPGRLLDDARELDPAWFAGVETVLVTAGASAPEDLVHGVIDALLAAHGGTVEQVDVDEEAVEFNLPVSLRREMTRRGAEPGDRRIRVDAGAAFDRYAAERGLPVRRVALTAGGRTIAPRPADA